MMQSNFDIKTTTFGFVRISLIAVIAGWIFVLSAQIRSTEAQSGEDRHICPVEAIRNGSCDPNPAKVKNTNAQKPKGTDSSSSRKRSEYVRVAKQGNTSAGCNYRTKGVAKQTTKSVTCEPPLNNQQRQDLPISSQKVGITIWKVSEVKRGYEGARILSHPDSSRPAVEYQAERIAGNPVVTYGDKVRLSIESPRNGYLYVFDREVYEDGSFSVPFLIFPTTRLRDGNNEIRSNSPIELPAISDNPFYFEAKKVGIAPGKVLVGEVLSIVITDQPISTLPIGRDANEILGTKMDSIEVLYSGRAEVFELDGGLGLPYSTAERDAATSGARLLTHNDPVPQTFYLVEDRRTGGLLVTLALKYQP